MLGVGFGSWRGENGMAVGAATYIPDTQIGLKAGAVFDGQGGAGVSAGIGIQF
jgi:autotransporter adhesin